MAKKCTRCKLLKPREEFFPRPAAADKLSSQCRECNRECCRISYAKSKAQNGGKCHRVRSCLKRRENRTETDWKLINMYWSAKKRSRKKGRNFDITPEDVLALYVERCPILGIELDWEVEGAKRASDSSPSLDRIDSTKGYSKDNIWIISLRANRIKSDGSPEELMAIAKALLNR
jgi:hypothetical protein